MKKRLFIAIDIAEQTKSLIRAIQSEFHFMKREIRFVVPQNIHMTIKFLGDVDSTNIPQLIDRIESSVRSFQKFDYICKGTGVFPSVKRPRVLWLGIASGSEKLGKLSTLLNEALKDMPVKQEDRKYRSHITLGRIKGFKKSVPRLKSFLSYRYEAVENNVSEIVLYESILNPQGAIYKPVHKFKLQ